MATAIQPGVVSLARRSLRKRILRAALTSPAWRTILAEAAEEIQRCAQPTATEATIQGAFERILYARLREIGLQFHPQKESGVNIKRHLARGRLDSRLGALLIEYKRPSLLKSAIEIDRALCQMKEYLIGITKDKPSSAPFVGVLTNGLVAVEVHVAGGIITSESAVEKVSGETLLRLTQHFISLSLTALTSSNLIREFCGSQTDGVLFQTARILNTILSNPEPKTRMLHSEWEMMFRLAQGDQSQQKRIEERRESLAALFNVEISNAADEYRALFALHTAYAILLKLIAYRTVSDIYLGEVQQDYKSLSQAANGPLRDFCGQLEDGDIFRQLKILNLLEGDFFSWYCDKKQWTSELAESIRLMLSILARYEEVGHIFEANEAPDLFRELYQAAVPRVVRSTFGEFYTPFWLAEHVFESVTPKTNWRMIDPCCGSGTFVIAAIARLRQECKSRNLDERETMREIVDRVVGIDLNPLGVLTTRINYFINICNLLVNSPGPLLIPVFLGDAAALPDRISLDGVESLSVTLKTLQAPIKAALPASLVQDTPKFMQLMFDYERHIKARRKDEANASIESAIQPSEKPSAVHKAIAELTDNLIKLEEKGWNGIWARIVSNFLTTACLRRFTVVIGNPPWIDWKNLPEGYRNRVKEMCIEKGLFSGAGRTGGINLNICALISYVAMTNWLDRDGRLAFLMPRELAYQASYEGWRRLGGKWKFLEFHDWSKAGHPYDPVKEDFMTYIIGSGAGARRPVPVSIFTKKRGITQKASEWKTSIVALDYLTVAKSVAGQIIPNSTAFTFARDQAELDEFALVAGRCEYIGREGIQFYPQELHLFRYAGIGPRPDTVWLTNVQAQKAQHKMPPMRVLLETKYLHPLVTAPLIEAFEYKYDGLLVAFPYESATPTKPIEPAQLREASPFLLAYYEKNCDIIGSLSSFNAKIRGPNPGAFYGLARTGPYRFADVYVAFRKDTKWCAAVVSSQPVPWGDKKRPVFQSHAVSMCERRGRKFISIDEAHYICAIFNAPVVQRFVSGSSDNRSFKVRPPLFVPLYDPEDARHVRLADISKEAHRFPERREALRVESENLYLNMCREEMFDATTARDRLKDINEGKVRLVSGDALQQELNSLLS